MAESARVQRARERWHETYTPLAAEPQRETWRWIATKIPCGVFDEMMRFAAAFADKEVAEEREAALNLAIREVRNNWLAGPHVLEDRIENLKPGLPRQVEVADDGPPMPPVTTYAKRLVERIVKAQNESDGYLRLVVIAGTVLTSYAAAAIRQRGSK